MISSFSVPREGPQLVPHPLHVGGALKPDGDGAYVVHHGEGLNRGREGHDHHRLVVPRVQGLENAHNGKVSGRDRPVESLRNHRHRVPDLHAQVFSEGRADDDMLSVIGREVPAAREDRFMERADQLFLFGVHALHHCNEGVVPV